MSAAHPGDASEAQAVAALVAQLADRLTQRSWLLITAESCTGGLIAAACTERAGSSRWFERGFVSYSNASKTELLGVPAALIEQHGAVSESVACAMVRGGLARSAAQVGVAVTGVAGPGGGSAEKPVGTVWFGFAIGNRADAECMHFAGDRGAVRAATVRHAIAGLLRRMPRHQVPD